MEYKRRKQWKKDRREGASLNRKCQQNVPASSFQLRKSLSILKMKANRLFHSESTVHFNLLLFHRIGLKSSCLCISSVMKIRANYHKMCGWYLSSVFTFPHCNLKQFSTFDNTTFKMIEVVNHV